MSSKSRPSLQSATDFSALQYGDDSNDIDTAKLYQHYISQMPDELPLSGVPQHDLSELPPPVTQVPSSQTRRARANKNVRVALNIRNHWEKFIRRFGAGSAPSTSSNVEDSTSESITFTRRPQDNPSAPEDPDELLDAIIVDREWSNDIKTASSHSEHGISPDKSGGSNHLPGTNTDHESLTVHPDGFWGKHKSLIYLRWRLWPRVYSFFCLHFMDEKAEAHYVKENWFLRKNLALWCSAFIILNWALAVGLIPKPVVLADKIFYYGLAPAMSFTVLPMVIFDWPRDRNYIYQVVLVFTIWMWGSYQIIFMNLCGHYNNRSLFECGGKDFLSLFYYTSALQTIGLFGLKLHRFPALCGALTFFGLACGLIVPIRTIFIRNLVNFVCFQTFLLYTHYMRENVRVPLNTALLAVQNMDASGIIAKHQEIEFKALEGSLSMMSKVLNDVLDFNRMDSGRFESVLRPYCFHKVMHSLFIPLKLATDARKLEFRTILDPDIDKIARIALHESLGESEEEIEKRLGEYPEEAGIVVGDETRLRQIITNLASNACKFTPTGGTLTIRTQLVIPCQRCKSDHEYGCEMDEAEVDEVDDQDQDLEGRDQDQDQRGDDEKSPSRVASPLPLNGDHLDITPVDEKGGVDEKTPGANAEKQQKRQREAKCRHHHHRHYHQHHHYNPAPRQYRVYEDGEEIEEVEVDNGDGHGHGEGHGEGEGGEERDPMSVLSRNHLTQHNSIHGKPPPPLEWIVVRIEVSDTGCGIRPKDMVQSKLFSAFNQTEAGRQQGGKGTGLGLALVRQIVKLSGGRLGLRSKVHEGSTFWVELPLGVGTKAIPGMAVAHLPPSEAELIMSRTSELVKKEELKKEKVGEEGEGEVEGGNDEKADVASPSSSQTVVPTGPSPATPRTVIGLSHMASRSSSALHSIMEQGGLVEISTKRGESSVPTRTIGDPSTGTDLTEPPKDDPSPSPTPADRLSCKDQSLETIRPSHVELPKPQRFSIDDVLPDGPLDASVSTTGTGNGNGNASGTGSGTSASTHSTSLSSGFDPAFAGLRVLVVDDDPLTRKLMSRLLTRLGCRVSTAENGEVALDKILGGAPSRATPSSEDTGSGGLMEVATTVLTPQDEARYNVVFLDNQMPVMSGLETVARLRAMGRNDFVVGVTGNALLTDQEEYLNTGVDHVLTKPVFEKSIKAMLTIANERRKLRGALGSDKAEPPPSPSSPTSPTVPASPPP